MPIFIVFGLTRLGIEPEFTASVADALSLRPLIGYITWKIGRITWKKGPELVFASILETTPFSVLLFIHYNNRLH